MTTLIGAETIFGSTIVGSIESGAYTIRHGNRILARVPLKPVARRLQVSGEAMEAIEDMQHTEVGGKFMNKIKKTAKKAITKVVKVAKTVAKSKATKALYAAAKMSAPTPYKEAITAGETAVRFTQAMTKNTKKGRAALAALPTVQALAAGKISLPAAQAKGMALGLKASTIRDAAAAMKMRTSNSPAAKAVMSVVSDIDKLTNSPTKIVEAASGRRYEVLVKAAG